MVRKFGLNISDSLKFVRTSLTAQLIAYCGLEKNVFSPIFGCSVSYLSIISNIINRAIYNMYICVFFLSFFLGGCLVVLSINEEAVLMFDIEDGFVSLSIYGHF